MPDMINLVVSSVAAPMKQRLAAGTVNCLARVPPAYGRRIAALSLSVPKTPDDGFFSFSPLR